MDTQTQPAIPKTEKKSKVKSISFKNSWPGKYGTMYDFNIEFENGDKGVFNSQKNPQDRFKEGEDVPYTIETVNRNGYVNVIIRPVVEKKVDSPKNLTSKNFRAEFIGYAAAYAKDLVVAGKVDMKDFSTSFEDIYGVMENKLRQINGQENINVNPVTAANGNGQN